MEVSPLLIVFGALILLGLGAAIGYVLLKSKASPETWMQLTMIVDRARQIFGNVFTSAEIAVIAKALYDGLKLDSSTNYTLEEFTAMLLRILPVSNPVEVRAIGADPVLNLGPEELAMQSEVDAILVDAKQKIEAGAA